jgi:hypothetical protein
MERATCAAERSSCVRSRIHEANSHEGVLALTFADAADYESSGHDNDVAGSPSSLGRP